MSKKIRKEQSALKIAELATEMEIMRIRFRGGSICAYIKRIYGITVRKKQDVADQFEKMVKEAEELAGY